MARASDLPAFFQTPAWLLIGATRSEPGVLTLDGGRLRYRTSAGTLFDVALVDVTDVAFPWYYFSGGVTLTAQSHAVRLSFLRPNDGEAVPHEWLQVPAGGTGLMGGRRAGKAWKAILMRDGG